MFDLPSYLMGSGSSGSGGGGSSTLVGLTDVDISNPTDGQTLVYNATSGKWENGQGGSGGGVLNVGCTFDMEEMTVTLDKSWTEITSAPFAIVTVNNTESSVLYLFFTGSSYSNVSWGLYAVMFNSSGSMMPVEFSAESPDEYPVASIGG